MNFPGTLYVLLETIAALLMFLVGYLAIFLFIILCLVIGDLTYEGVRAHKENTHSLDHAVSSKAKVDANRSWVRHRFQH